MSCIEGSNPSVSANMSISSTTYFDIIDFPHSFPHIKWRSRDLISVVADPIFNTQPSIIHKVRFVVGDQCHP